MSHEKVKGKVLVLGEDERAFLTVIRSLGRKGLRVHVGWCPADAVALRSRYVDKAHDLPRYRPGSLGWMESLEDLIEREAFDLVIPCHDQTIIPLQKHAHEFNNVESIYLLSPRAYRVVSSKAETGRLARALEIPMPKETTISSLGQLDQIVSEFELPLILKPISSFSQENPTAKHYVRRVYTIPDLRSELETMLSRGNVLVQQNFVGKGAGLEVLAQGGEILAAFQHLRVHEPLGGGGSSYRKSTAVSADLLEAGRKFLKAIDYTGVAMVEFKINPKTGRWILVEVNGRFWGSLPLALSAGVDFPYYLYEMLVLGKTRFEVKYRENIYCRNFTRDLAWMRDNLRADHSDPYLDTLPWRAVAGEAINIISLREHFDTLVRDDPAPGLVEIGRLMSKGAAKMISGPRWAFAHSAAVRRQKLRRIRHCLHPGGTVAFVCKGNICRSPFAEQYARRVFPPTLQVVSFGYYPEGGRCCPQEAVGAAAEAGLDLSRHRSRVLHDEAIRQADVIFTFDKQNHRTVLEAYPRSASKIFSLGLLLNGESHTISDPYGKGLIVFRATYERIKRAIDTLNSELQENMLENRGPRGAADRPSKYL